MWTPPSVHHGEQQFVVLYLFLTQRTVLLVFSVRLSPRSTLTSCSSQKRTIWELAHKDHASHLFKRAVMKIRLRNT